VKGREEKRREREICKREERNRRLRKGDSKDNERKER
jgi:hypothetical protein